jgi:radical SAM superfamily enzyme YgiQ (UPF0313 family)
MSGERPDCRPVPIYSVSYCDYRSLPLGLGMIQAYAEGPRLASLRSDFRFMPLLNMPVPQVLKIAKAFGPGIWLFSNYLWTIDRALRISQALKEIDPRNVTIHGGPSAPKHDEACQRYMRRFPQIDVAARGEGELTTADLIEHFVTRWGDADRHDGMESIAGITYRRGDGPDELVRTGERPRIDDLGALPSPFLGGAFDNCYSPRPIQWATLETNRGCPYQCTFCDWGALTQQKIKLFDLDRVKAEIEWIGRRKIPIVHIADANVGIIERDLEIAEHFGRVRREFGFPTHITCSLTKNGSPRVPEMARIWRDSGIDHVSVLSIQTTDEDTLNILKRRNIKTQSFEKQISALRKLGVPMTAELMIGLPGQTVASFKRDLQFLADKDIVVTAYLTRLLPNSEMADPDYRARFRIEVDEKDNVLSTFSHTQKEREEIIQLRNVYGACMDLSCLRYLLWHLQWEHGVESVDFLHELLRKIRRSPESFSPVTRLVHGENQVFVRELFQNSAAEFHSDVIRFAETRFGIQRDAAFDAVLRVNEAVLPKLGGTYPKYLVIPHDVTAYFLDRGGNGPASRKLSDYPAGTLTVTDPDGWAGRDPRNMFPEITLRLVNWELHSSLRDAMGNRPAPRTDGKISA